LTKDIKDLNDVARLKELTEDLKKKNDTLTKDEQKKKDLDATIEKLNEEIKKKKESCACNIF